MKVHEKIVSLRRAAGLTQEKLGALLNVSPQAVSKWENAECLPDIALLPALCAALHVSADELLDIAPQPVCKGTALVRADRVRIAAATGVTMTIEGAEAVKTVQAADVAPLLELLSDDAALCILRVLGFGAIASETELAEKCGLSTDAVRAGLFRLRGWRSANAPRTGMSWAAMRIWSMQQCRRRGWPVRQAGRRSPASRPAIPPDDTKKTLHRSSVFWRAIIGRRTLRTPLPDGEDSRS